MNTVVPISYDMSANPELVNEINQWLNKGGKSFFYSEQLTNQSDLPTYIVIDSELTQSNQGEIAEENFAKIYSQIPSEQLMEIDFPEPIKFEASDVSQFDERIFYSFYEDEVIIVLLQTNRLDKWIDTEYGLEITGLLDNASVNKLNEADMTAELEVILEGSFLSYQPSNHQNNEVDFLKFYIYPAVGLVIASLLVGLTIMYVSLFKKLYREYTIHLISGATLKHIFARNSVFIVALIFVCLLIIAFLNGFIFNDILKIAIAVLAFISIVFEVLLYVTLKRKNLSMTLRGDD